jgi:hypothetical protein
VAANPTVTAAPTRSARAKLARGSSSSPSMPMKNDRYAGSMAKPHGLTVATIPVVKASASGASIT